MASSLTSKIKTERKFSKFDLNSHVELFNRQHRHKHFIYSSGNHGKGKHDCKREIPLHIARILHSLELGREVYVLNEQVFMNLYIF